MRRPSGFRYFFEYTCGKPRANQRSVCERRGETEERIWSFRLKPETKWSEFVWTKLTESSGCFLLSLKTGRRFYAENSRAAADTGSVRTGEFRSASA